MAEYKDLSVGDIADLLRPDADAIARSLLPGGRYEDGGREWRCTGRNSPTGTAISVHVGPGDKQGVCGFWNEAKRGGDLLDLYELVTGCTKSDAVGWAKDRVGVGDAPATRLNLRQRRRNSDAHEQQNAWRVEQRLTSASRIWKECGSLEGVGAVYLQKRGLDPSYAGPEIRLHTSLPHPAGGVFPALVARVTGARGVGIGVWRIYLKPTGDGKAPVENPKLGLGKAQGGAVRIGGVWTEIGVAEGVETALACRQIIHRSTGIMMPVWPALSSSGLRSLQLPPEVQSIRIFADHDPIKFRQERVLPSAGRSAANELAARLIKEGRKVKIVMPPVGMDWLDVLNAIPRTAKAA